jgi:hypothetical protein
MENLPKLGRLENVEEVDRRLQTQMYISSFKCVSCTWIDSLEMLTHVLRNLSLIAVADQVNSACTSSTHPLQLVLLESRCSVVRHERD